MKSIESLQTIEKIEPCTFIVNDFEKVKEELSQELNDYKVNEIADDESFKDSKAKKAELNRLADTLNNRRKDFQKKYLEPFNQGKKQYDELIKLISDKSGEYSNEIDKYDEKYKGQKESELKQYFERVCKLPIEWEQIKKDSWLNRTSKIEVAKDEILNIVIDLNKSTTIIKLTCKDDTKTLKQVLYFFFQTLDFDKAITLNTIFDKKMEDIDKYLEDEMK